MFSILTICKLVSNFSITDKLYFQRLLHSICHQARIMSQAMSPTLEGTISGGTAAPHLSTPHLESTVQWPDWAMLEPSTPNAPEKGGKPLKICSSNCRHMASRIALHTSGRMKPLMRLSAELQRQKDCTKCTGCCHRRLRMPIRERTTRRC